METQTKPYIGNGAMWVASDLRREGERWVDPQGHYGYYPHFGGGWVCYTDGQMCECGEDCD